MRLRQIEAGVLCGLARLLTGVTVKGAVPGDSDLRSFVFYANHSSHLDAVVLWLSLPPSLRLRTRPVAARDYWERSRVRRHLAACVFNALLIDRGQGPGDGRSSLRRAAEALDSMVAALRDGASLIVFPEGTRGAGDQAGEFRSGLYQLARRRPDVAFVPVYLENLNRILPKGEWLAVPLLGSAYFGEALAPADGEARSSFLERSRLALNALRGAVT